MQELRRGRRRLLIKAQDKEHWLRQIYDKHLGNPAPKIGSTPQPCTYLPFVIYTLLTLFLLFPVFDKHFWKSHLPLSCYILFTVKCTSQEDNKVLWLSLCSSNKGTITGGDPTAPKIGSSPLCRCLHPIKKGKRWFQVSIVGIIAAIICF